MNILINKIVPFFILIFSVSIAWAQDYHDVLEKSLNNNKIENQLPPLQQLLDSAETHSPLLKMYDSDVIIQELKIKSEKKDWMKSLGFQAGARYGLFDNLILKEDLGVEDLKTSTTEQTRYNLGLYLKIPLSSILDKNNQKIAEEEVNRIKYQKANSALELRKLIIVQYNNVVKAYKSMVIRINDLETYRIQMIRAEKDYQNGQINVAEYARLKDFYLNSKLDLENNKVEFVTALQLLQETAGININLKF